MKQVDLIRTYKVLPDKVCNSLVKFYQEHPEHHVHRGDKYKNFYELNVNQHYPSVVSVVSNYLYVGIKSYLRELKTYSPYFDIKSVEEFRIKSYSDPRHEFKTHVDVGDINSCRRQLAFLFYLNDDFTGGETQFSDTLISPRKGDILIFPPMWMYPHAGLPVTGGTKYIMSSYLHYT